ncbi:GPR1/FUN34/YaaH family transporter [Solicola gregarius]|uniref:Acetate uptake transporter family protein n=1 Tax=Solicola gregarius TaxID=2908642 RepID=A0AA46YM54_9ACTN|nr:GPR1/FUN34/YaaH family transporter [Solicola gregarius]UYM06299.1 acetate uptake transporter family protein [Solicola gregarius]
MKERIGDSSVFGLSTFGFALAMLGLELLIGQSLAGATLYAVLVAGLGETLGGLFALVRGDGYLAGVLTTFGLWLIGYYFYLTQGAAAGAVSDESTGALVLLLIAPLLILAYPAMRAGRVVLSVAFLAIALTLGAVGIGTLAGQNSLLQIGGVLSLISAAAIWYLAAEAGQHSYAEAHAEA